MALEAEDEEARKADIGVCAKSEKTLKMSLLRNSVCLQDVCGACDSNISVENASAVDSKCSIVKDSQALTPDGVIYSNIPSYFIYLFLSAVESFVKYRK